MLFQRTFEPSLLTEGHVVRVTFDKTILTHFGNTLTFSKGTFLESFTYNPTTQQFKPSLNGLQEVGIFFTVQPEPEGNRYTLTQEGQTVWYTIGTEGSITEREKKEDFVIEHHHLPPCVPSLELPLTPSVSKCTSLSRRSFPTPERDDEEKNSLLSKVTGLFTFTTFVKNLSIALSTACSTGLSFSKRLVQGKHPLYNELMEELLDSLQYTPPEPEEVIYRPYTVSSDKLALRSSIVRKVTHQLGERAGEHFLKEAAWHAAQFDLALLAQDCSLSTNDRARVLTSLQLNIRLSGLSFAEFAATVNGGPELISDLLVDSLFKSLYIDTQLKLKDLIEGRGSAHANLYSFLLKSFHYSQQSPYEFFNNNPDILEKVLRGFISSSLEKDNEGLSLSESTSAHTTRSASELFAHTIESAHERIRHCGPLLQSGLYESIIEEMRKLIEISHDAKMTKQVTQLFLQE